eukprot:CAMPEP_0206478832 /NCGR_PEP_ID=MMETSP0324_2-20121206/36324_1 /ASSEMBLY_ACC=CAM_ASM_000836 /TAXON_ID=2866 /ORGANISM="Crypthecodinium cohnii, Strain Seligo" /LENGTH=163 /DNA_ID=CAMNT_0053955285 /DNA_START=888 /DNA_END=1379 /DNA_ORIENTATION=+
MSVGRFWGQRWVFPCRPVSVLSMSKTHRHAGWPVASPKVAFATVELFKSDPKDSELTDDASVALVGTLFPSAASSSRGPAHPSGRTPTPPFDWTSPPRAPSVASAGSTAEDSALCAPRRLLCVGCTSSAMAPSLEVPAISKKASDKRGAMSEKRKATANCGPG